MDNFRFDITCNGDIKPAMRIAFRANRVAIGYRIDDQRGLIFYSTKHPSATQLPFKLDADGAADFATRWLIEQEYGPEPDHDGDNGRGWRVYNEEWGHIASQWEAFVAVKPAWAMFGK